MLKLFNYEPGFKGCVPLKIRRQKLKFWAKAYDQVEAALSDISLWFEMYLPPPHTFCTLVNDC